ncbi:MAG: ATP-binding protein [bacterium]|nr:ATP-binding protein [bacterium]
MRFRAIQRSYSSLPYSHRIFVATAGIVTVAMTCAAVVDVLNSIPSVAAVSLGGACAFGVLTYLAFQRRNFKNLFWAFVGLSLVITILQQINQAGYDGAVPIIYIAVAVVLFSIADPSQHRRILGVLLATSLGLFAFEELRPDWLQSYASESARRLDSFFVTLLAVFSVWGVVGGLRRNFDTERDKLRESNARLLETARKLRRAQQTSETATRARKSFLSTMSHEIRTPLNSIIGLAHLIQSEEDGAGAAKNDGALSNDDRKSVRTIRFAAEHLLSLINDILDYSRLDSGVVEPEARLIHVENWLNELIETLRPAAQKNGVVLELHLPEARPLYIQSDISRLTQILSNLLSNAMKFAEGGRVDLHLHTRKLTEITWDLCFEIRDTGVGIPEDRLETIFDEFTQAESNTYRQFGGTGLGLAIVRRLVELFGGDIRVESEVGVGSRFFVDLALGVGSPEKSGQTGVERSDNAEDFGGDSARQGLPAAGMSQPEAHAGVNDSATLAGRLALIVEDFEMNRIIAERFLKRWGLEVMAAESGGAALALLEDPQNHDLHFDVILMDIQMPGLDGYETTRLIRGLGGARATVPILALTAASLPEEREQAISAGMNDYVAKPFRPDDLRQALLRNLRSAK